MRVAARATASFTLRGLRRARERALRALPRAPTPSLRSALRALRRADRLAGAALSGMLRPSNRLRQRARGASLHRLRSESRGGLEGARSSASGRRAGRAGRRDRSAPSSRGADLRACAARTGALAWLPPGPVARARTGAHLGAALRSPARAGGIAEAPTRSGAQRAQPECGLCLCAARRREHTRWRLFDRRRIHQRRDFVGLRRRSTPGRLPPG